MPRFLAAPVLYLFGVIYRICAFCLHPLEKAGSCLPEEILVNYYLFYPSNMVKLDVSSVYTHVARRLYRFLNEQSVRRIFNGFENHFDVVPSGELQ